MTAIISIDEPTNLLKTQTLDFVAQFNLPLVSLRDYDWSNLIFTLLDDKLSQRFRWTTPSTRFEHALERSLPWFASNGVDQYSAHYMTTVLDELHHELNRIACLLIPVPTWDVWCIRLTGDSVMATQGDDFRILEWNRLVESGAIKDPLKRL